MIPSFKIAIYQFHSTPNFRCAFQCISKYFLVKFYRARTLRVILFKLKFDLCTVKRNVCLYISGAPAPVNSDKRIENQIKYKLPLKFQVNRIIRNEITTTNFVAIFHFIYIFGIDHS